MKTSSVTTRPYREEDAPGSFAAILESMDDLSRWMPWCHPGYSLTDAEAWFSGAKARFDNHSAFEFAIIGDDGAFVGGCGLNQIKPIDRVANLGYWVRSSLTSRGIATEAARQVIAWAFRETDLVRLEIIVAVANPASCRVAEKLGALREAVLRKRIVLDGHSVDAVMYSIIRPE